ncbi:MAG: citrate synthase [Brucellaceae bacterium]|nr:citrate synthase [Brucellaceae bacterium]
MTGPVHSEPLFLSAREAASELSISAATLYAYVSRGLIRSEAEANSRRKRYRADDVRALKQRRDGPGPTRTGDAGLPVLDTAIGTITEDGPVYRGVHALALSREAGFEQVATLLWAAGGVDPFTSDNVPVVSAAMAAVIAATRDEAPISRAIAVLALAGAADPRAYNRSREGRVLLAARVARLATAAILGTGPDVAPIHRQVAAAWAPAEPGAPDLFRRALVLLADHELNASTYSLRCATSTGLTLYDAAVAGLVALKGPRHGGAGALAAGMVSDLAEGDLAARIRERVSLGDRIPGFGHSVYERSDPRADDLLQALGRAGADPQLVLDAPHLITEATGLHPNIDYALAVMMHMLGRPPGFETALFAIARLAGWLAHAIEQLETATLIRPRARYVGNPPGRLLPLSREGRA